MAIMSIERLQRDLAVKGLYLGRVDGIWGNKSELAYRQLLKSAEADLTQPEVKSDSYLPLAWGNKVTGAFKGKVIDICQELKIPDPNWLMACMAFESGETFSPSITNGAGSGATGLIQFMPSTARALGTDVDTLARMSAYDQLDYVEEYFRPYTGRLNNLGDVYMAILWPAGIGELDSWTLWDSETRPTTYRQNSGLDIDDDGKIVRAEAVAKIREKLNKGLKSPYFG